MSKTPFSKKVEILGQVWVWYKDDPNKDDGWVSFFEWHDVSLPLAYLAANDFASIKKDKRYFIEDTWREYCVLLGIDPSAGYLDVRHTFEVAGAVNA